ncbi:hypothetical protein RCL1_002402 [Eukaryota sp. TZLM3-RCL]
MHLLPKLIITFLLILHTVKADTFSHALSRYERSFNLTFCYGSCSIRDIVDHLTGRKNLSGRCGLATYTDKESKWWIFNVISRKYTYGSDSWNYRIVGSGTQMAELIAHGDLIKGTRAEIGLRLNECEDFQRAVVTAAVTVAAAVVVAKGIAIPAGLATTLSGLAWGYQTAFALADIPVPDVESISSKGCEFWNSKIPTDLDFQLGWTSDTWNDSSAWYLRISKGGRSWQIIFDTLKQQGMTKQGDVVCIHFNPNLDPICAPRNVPSCK